jgi:hypothetical protein
VREKTSHVAADEEFVRIRADLPVAGVRLFTKHPARISAADQRNHRNGDSSSALGGWAAYPLQNEHQEIH